MGGSNLAARRGAKAVRRKAIRAQKRKAEAFEETLAAQMARAATLPIRECLLGADLFEGGIGSLILVRGGTIGPVSMGAFLLDVFCRGVKDVVAYDLEQHELELCLDRVNRDAPMVSVEPSYARKLLRDLAEWSASLGFPPARDFATVERIFGNVDPQACETRFEFGEDGKPLYIAGPHDTPAITRRHMEQMRARLGPDGFEYIVAA